jgi:uncharacterized membrane protein YphA (DoxX/SURF4 family)
MSPNLQLLLGPKTGPRSVLLVRIAVGLIFFTQGILKYIDPNLGVGRFTRIGFPHPYFTAHFVGTFEILCGFFLLLGLWTRLVSTPLFVVITTAIATTKIPEYRLLSTMHKTACSLTPARYSSMSLLSVVR